MIKHLQKVGHSSALILDRPLMELLGLQEGGEVQLTVANGSLIITPANPRAVDRGRFEKCLRKVVSERREALRRLGE